MSLLTKILFLSLLSLINLQTCDVNVNNCLKCNPMTNLCVQCSYSVYIPDENGGCVPYQKCTAGLNFCDQCNSKETLCLVCDIGYYPDENGACSYTDNCEISYNGDCLNCKNDFYLLDNKFCKYKYSEDLKNCKEINSETGKCSSCESGYFLSSSDFKCIEIKNCMESIFGVCQKCNEGYYLDKQDDTCKEAKNNFSNCQLSIDGETCEQCADLHYFTEKSKKCVSYNFCEESDENFNCIKCVENYYMTIFNNSCTQEQNCKYGDKDLGICTQCLPKNYLDYKDGKCKTNQEENDFKFCSIVSDEKCTFCDSDYDLSEDFKCTNTKNCALGKNGVCESCQDNFYLGKDNICTNVENCIYSYMYICYECIDNYIYNRKSMKCEEITNENFKNCRSSSDGTECDYCKANYYLSLVDHLCYSNEEKGNLYKCAISSDGKICSQCVANYYLGEKDKKCSKNLGCALLSENDNEVCAECENTFCLDLKKGTCFDNENPPTDENELIYFNCNKTNEEGTECEECINDNFEIINGLCYNIGGCEKIEDGKCVECKEKSQCVNKNYGCVDSFGDNCLKCDNDLDLDTCDECREGYEFDKFGNCVESE